MIGFHRSVYDETKTVISNNIIRKEVLGPGVIGSTETDMIMIHDETKHNQSRYAVMLYI